MDKIKLYQKLPFFMKNLIASYRGYQLVKLRALNRDRYLSEIKEHDQWTKNEIRAFQKIKCEEMLDHAVKNVPYYRELWKDIKETDPSKNHLNLKDWPILEKDTIRSNADAFIADGVDKSKLTHIPTSGTSGKPMNFYLDRYTITYWYAMYEARIRNWNGLKETDRWASVAGQLICDIDQKEPPFWVWNSYMNQLYVSSYHITPKNISHYLKAFKKYKVEYLLGYVSSMYNLAAEGLKQNLEMPKLKSAITTAEPLYDFQRTTIEEAFQCKVVETYSSCEFAFGSNAHPNGQIYLWPEAGIVEVADQNGNIHESGKGEVLATGFLNKAMPLIRYRLGDTVNLNTGIKGKPEFDYFEEIIGRTDDLVLTRDGKFVGRLDPVFKSNIKIKESQIIQEDLLNFTVRIVPDIGFGEDDEKSITSRLKDRVGQDIKVQFEKLEQIPRGPNGKFKAVVSRVK
ncbi:MAG: phenylacetate--CoA ligase family protein [Flavobacteriales bacterium]|nr:phenylacetate--CoA ligase family protein [Flavobacteriales bacterium]